MDRKIQIITMAAITLTIAVVASGCVHNRTTVLVAVDDLGSQIVTKNKYTPVYSDGILSLGKMMRTGKMPVWTVPLDRLIAEQPQVFSSNGIPFVVERGFGSVSPNGSTPFIVPLLIPFIIPGCGEGSPQEFKYTIDVVDCPDAHATFQQKERRDSCFALLTPLPMVFYPTAGVFDDEPEKKRKFTRHSFSLGLTADSESFKEDMSASQSATAYGIAVALKQMEESGKISPATSRTAGDVESQNANLRGGANFDIVDFHRTDSDSHRYVFSLVSTNENVSLRESLAAKRVLSNTISHDFMASYPSVNRTVLAVDFTEYEFANGVIKGAANVLPLNILAYNYDKYTRKGCMRIKVRADQFEAARRYVRQNIESVVRDKNIALIVGEIPPHARFELLDESVADGVLEVNFKAE